MKWLLVLALILVPCAVWATPFVVSDAYPPASVQPDNFKVTVDGGAVINSTPQTVPEGVRFHHDIGSVTVGNHAMTVKACKTYPADEWHPDPVEACSATVNFPFARPAEPTSPGAPANIRLSN